MLAKSLEELLSSVGRANENPHDGVWLDGETAFVKRTQGMKAGRKGVRTLPRDYRPRNKERDVEGETATCVEASTGARALVSAHLIPSGYVAVACFKRSVHELGRPVHLLGNGVGKLD